MILLVRAGWRGGAAAEVLAAGARGKLDLVSLPPHERLPEPARIFLEALTVRAAAMAPP